MNAWLLLLLTLPGEPLAPSVLDLDASLDRLEQLTERAERTERSWAATERRFFDRCVMLRCASHLGARLVAQSRGEARELRAFAQSARAELGRARRMASVETVRPLVRGEREARMRTLDARARRAADRYVTRLAWHDRYVEAWAVYHPGPIARAVCAPSKP